MNILTSLPRPEEQENLFSTLTRLVKHLQKFSVERMRELLVRMNKNDRWTMRLVIHYLYMNKVMKNLEK